MVDVGNGRAMMKVLECATISLKKNAKEGATMAEKTKVAQHCNIGQDGGTYEIGDSFQS